MNQLLNVGIYTRLSVEDSANSAKRDRRNPFRHESTSIENQESILREYAQVQGWNVACVYSDDGYSGGSYSRPAFQKMLDDVKSGLIDLILVKEAYVKLKLKI
ncbi:MAG: recombinase family protein [Defluviitaleaceae bacterium]|nr:recombinase family protein [Defluviitaleaceae bacterium]MCL2835235.1 recombinase family protein [Defluviitaleaceae bacterium]